MVRSLLERVTHGLVFKRRLPARYGGCAFYASSEGGLRYLRPDVAKIDLALLDATLETVRPGDVVWDVGANVGLFSFAAAGIAGPAGRVFAIEPDTEMLRLLRRSAALVNRGAAPVETLPLAVADSISLCRFRIAARARSYNYLDGHESVETGGVRETQTVMTVTLDWLAAQLPAPSVLKIDAERAELRILESSRDFLARFRPRVLCEVAREHQEQAGRILRDCGYVLFDGDEPKTKRRPLLRAAWSTIAIPASECAGVTPPSPRHPLRSSAP